ncbi:peptidase S9 [Pseudomonas abyssi]|jgi:oligopeptidase B|uniref:Peptidase S9 n=1 Tax=Pseudomonas abyssi TaxID=170540 RepID=A0A2A3MI44_9PSED|nr:S9 family peptidase [Pseudomonas abyssi]MAD01527.1 S9 family peptidase [Pseudomonadales bacterium]PBK04451.1 peptidase S9 [Pseudomonas abyssi]|tara:strand:+ start:65335 stop:67353 length:2019 start_codon:yes stop_codon:yes gene_type:complete
MRPDLKAPHARRDVGTDPYQWLQERDSTDVTAYLEAENHYTEQWLAPAQSLREQLFQEIRGRIRETDLGLPSVRDNWLYYQRTEAGAEYPRYYRCQQQSEFNLEIDTASEQLLLDPNPLAEQHPFLELGDFSVSPDQNWLAYSIDTQGNEVYQLFVRSLTDEQEYNLSLEQAAGTLCWANDNRTLFAISLDASARPATLWRLRQDAEPVAVFEERDPLFYLDVYRSSSERYICVASSSKNTSELHYLPADEPAAPLQCLAARRSGHEYDADHGEQGFVIRSNSQGENFGLFACDPATPGEPHWQALRAVDDNRTLEGVELQRSALILQYRNAGLIQLEVQPNSGPGYLVAMPDAVYSLHVQGGEQYSSPQVRLRYESLNRPAEIRALTLADGSQRVLRTTPVEGQFSPDDYHVERLWAVADDGARIPISLIEPANAQGSSPLYLYGYGAYGASMDPWFSHARLSLLQRGWRFAIAHVRGGAEMGEHWYQQGKLEHKENTFSDFIRCAEQLISLGKTDSRQLAIAGGSAGGLLIGNVINQRPELFRAAVADVPFVDVWNTMNNPELPLTIGEYEEWGDPSDPKVAARIKGYAPYENVRPQAYPAMLVTAGYHDVRVQYWEAAKWVARLRATRSNDEPLLLRTQMSAGHGGASGRYQAMREIAEEYAFLLSVLS